MPKQSFTTRLLWQLVAAVVSRPAVASWLITRSQRTPYCPITSRDGASLYMDRWWLFNAYTKDEHGTEQARWSWLPSIRVHHIVRADDDEHLHDHPWDARTIVLRGWYREERPLVDSDLQSPDMCAVSIRHNGGARSLFWRRRSYTGPVLFNAYHRIEEVPPQGVYTLWFTWRYQGTWGFLVDGKKVPWREYLKGGTDA